ncbi:right-handed parallel beta-helix repeat-containing protein, partial [Candidatus Eisenbacteria bacterium]
VSIEVPVLPEFINCFFSGNSSGDGGAVYSTGTGAMTFTGCVFVDNTASVRGGALEVSQGSPVVTGCSFYGNSAPGGGVLDGRGSGVFAFTDCTLADNHADQGAAFYCGDDGSLILENSLVAFCTGLETFLLAPGLVTTLTCCNLYGNENGDWVGDIADQLGVNGNITADPLFCDREAQDYHLRNDSPCVASSPPNEACDQIGAYGVACTVEGVQVCCVETECYLVTESECTTLGGDWEEELESCDPNPCGTPVERVSWGRVKTMFRR